MNDPPRFTGVRVYADFEDRGHVRGRRVQPPPELVEGIGKVASRQDQGEGLSVTSGRFLALHHMLLDSAAWSALSSADRAVYVELAALYNGRNNGRLALSVRDASRRCRMNKDTAAAAFRSLASHGFVERISGDRLQIGQAAEWLLTMHRCDRTGAPGTRAFLDWSSAAQVSDVGEEA